MRTGRGLALCEKPQRPLRPIKFIAAIDLHSILQQIQCRMQQEDFTDRSSLISIDAAVDNVLVTIAVTRVEYPAGVGKPNPCQCTLPTHQNNPARRLRIITALSLEKPVGKSELEEHFRSHFRRSRVRGLPDLEYVKDLRAGHLPENIEVREFFMKTGDYLGNVVAQQGLHLEPTTPFVARDMAV